MKRLIVGLTGPTGSGKSYVAGIFAERCVPAINADTVVHQLYQPGTLCTRKIQEMFGDVLREDGSVDRKALGAIVYSDREAMKRLNALVHDMVKRITADTISALPDSCRMYLIDAPLLYEAGMDAMCDSVIGVIADKATRIRRIMARDGITEQEAAARIRNQHGIVFFRNRCSFIIYNNDGDDPASQVGEFLRWPERYLK